MNIRRLFIRSDKPQNCPTCGRFIGANVCECRIQQARRQIRGEGWLEQELTVKPVGMPMVAEVVNAEVWAI